MREDGGIITKKQLNSYLIDSDFLDDNIKIYNEIKSSIVHEYKHMVVFRHDNEFVVWNIKKPLSNKKTKGHSHIASFKMAKLICKNIVNNKKPKSRNMYILRSYVRCATKVDYIDKIEELISVRKQKGKKTNYRNKTYAT